MVQQPFVRKIGALWGVTGVIALLGFSVYRLAPLAAEIMRSHLTSVHISTLVIWSIIMIYTEGYKSFGQHFVPRVVARAQHLAHHGTKWQIVLAPIYCIGYFGAPRKRIIASVTLFAGILILIVVVSFLPKPWRGIVDTGVVLGLLCGIYYLVLYGVRALRTRTYVADPEAVS